MSFLRCQCPLYGPLALSRFRVVELSKPLWFTFLPEGETHDNPLPQLLSVPSKHVSNIAPSSHSLRRSRRSSSSSRSLAERMLSVSSSGSTRLCESGRATDIYPRIQPRPSRSRLTARLALRVSRRPSTSSRSAARATCTPSA